MVIKMESWFLTDPNTVSKVFGAYFKPKIIKKWNDIEKLIPKDVKKADVLDIGAGYGFFVEELILQGFNAKGVELSKIKVDYLNKKLKKQAIIMCVLHQNPGSLQNRCRCFF